MYTVLVEIGKYSYIHMYEDASLARWVAEHEAYEHPISFVRIDGKDIRYEVIQARFNPNTLLYNESDFDHFYDFAIS